ncbi:MAG: 5-bromo-4-chloroindolyl phosphate hydrolysis family protein [Tissierellia bacterium]|nr:5-bromo-4-chloroindolyl phosphate hydrolysis family protein [Tissierellia bacterium]
MKYRKIIAILAAFITFFVLNESISGIEFLSLFFSAGVYFAVKTVLKSEPKPKEVPPVKVEILNDENELKQIMNNAYEDLMDIQRAYRKARHDSIKIKGERLYHTGVNIFEHLRKNPKKIRQARRYLNYYLDTAATIMNKYSNFIDTGLNTQETEKIYNETDRALEILNKAFNKQFVKLMENDMMDMEADIKVLEDTLKTED